MNPAQLAALLALATFPFWRTRYRLYFCFLSLGFGAFSVLPTALVGGISVVLPTLAFLALVGLELVRPGAPIMAWTVARDLRLLGTLSLFTVVMVVITFFGPRLFQGQIYVYPMRPTAGTLFFLEPLTTSTANFTQQAYLLVSYLVALMFAVRGGGRFAYRDLRTGLLFLGAIVVASGMIDLVLYGMGQSRLLQIFQTASYAFLTEQTILGAKRISGFAAEASAYGALAAAGCGALLFTRRSFPPGLQRQIAFVLAGLCGVLAMMSTSSTAYGCMAMVGGLFFANAGLMFLSPKPGERTAGILDLFGGLIVVMAGVFVMLFNTTLWESVLEFYDLMVGQKATSQSYLERSGWTSAALDGLARSHGVGIGAGSFRGSNFFVNLWASTGIVGGILFTIALTLVALTGTSHLPQQEQYFIRGLKLTLVVLFTGYAFSSTSPDYGVFAAALIGTIVSCAVRRRDPAARRRPPSPPAAYRRA